MAYAWNNMPYYLQPTMRPSFDQYFWNTVHYPPTPATTTVPSISIVPDTPSIWTYTQSDISKCFFEDTCFLPLTLAILLFCYIATFTLTTGVLFVIAAVYGILSKIYCIFYQSVYFVSAARWSVKEPELEDLRKTVLANREVANFRFKQLEDDSVQINKLLNTFGL